MTTQTFSRCAAKTLIGVAALCGAVWTSSALADAEGERLIQAVPPHFRIVGRDNTKAAGLVQLVPDDQTGAHWTEMLTTQIFYNPKATSFMAYRGELEREWQGSCDKTGVDYAMDGEQNGYPINVWVQSCRFRSTSSKPNIALIKMITGRDSVYVIQVNFRYVPDQAKVAQWSSYLDKVTVCDSRMKGRECPAAASP
ncbi:hypothetical protein [Dyella telluris]|uniref:Uncharacterized protein n=1 Tax=Dyella telluris TaxID=2763498 RepID=A0A7G8Q7X2_9GAMM|nr:hypothetical protein [Dyella telluris]QNK02880.1 hypothetical protein H8F01_07105 [Dyella telluris]